MIHVHGLMTRENLEEKKLKKETMSRQEVVRSFRLTPSLLENKKESIAHHLFAFVFAVPRMRSRNLHNFFISRTEIFPPENPMLLAFASGGT